MSDKPSDNTRLDYSSRSHDASDVLETKRKQLYETGSEINAQTTCSAVANTLCVVCVCVRGQVVYLHHGQSVN